ncbi:MAG: hypothetical protein EPN23_00435 [Verrucomicrobia bacterium]|nr:MAG: hypothetical protein EPN23_00435 [Verrucomicrobiota bacterium]
MKHRLPLVTALLLAGTAFAAVDISKLPAGVRRIERIKDAQAEARQQKKALMFALSEMTPKGGGKGNAFVLGATQQLIQKMRGLCVVVFVDFTNDRAKLAKVLPKIDAAFDSEAAKGPIPRTVVTDAAAEKIYAIIPYAPAGPFGEEMIKEAKQKIQDGLAGKTVTDDVGIPGEKNREIAAPPSGKKKKKPNNDN